MALLKQKPVRDVQKESVVEIEAGRPDQEAGE
jgi:hypothetical protein